MRAPSTPGAAGHAFETTPQRPAQAEPTPSKRSTASTLSSMSAASSLLTSETDKDEAAAPLVRKLLGDVEQRLQLRNFEALCHLNNEHMLGWPAAEREEHAPDFRHRVRPWRRQLRSCAKHTRKLRGGSVVETNEPPENTQSIISRLANCEKDRAVSREARRGNVHGRARIRRQRLPRACANFAVSVEVCEATRALSQRALLLFERCMYGGCGRSTR